METDKDISIIIPTYNGGSYFLKNVLTALASQDKINFLNIEVIVVDNNSTDNTKDLILSLKKGYPFVLKYLFESSQGQAYARSAGIKIAKGKYVALLDDDNIPSLQWIYYAYKFGQEHTSVGIWSGKVFGLFGDISFYDRTFFHKYLSVFNYGEELFEYNVEKYNLPSTAGLICRKSALVGYDINKQLLTGLNGPFGIYNGEDTEFIMQIARNGWEVYYVPWLLITHLISKKRTSFNYLFSLCKGYSPIFVFLRLRYTDNYFKTIVSIFWRAFNASVLNLFLYIISFGNLKYKFKFYEGIIPIITLIKMLFQ